MDFDAVAKAIRFAERQEIAPRFRNLKGGDVEEKSPGEVVTAADRACEEVLTPLLREVSDVPVVGEEAAQANPALLNLINSLPAVWLLDPLDGTSNFANGIAHYAVMAAYIEDGVATSSCMWNPSTRRMSIASRGAGAEINGTAVIAEASIRPVAESIGVVKTKFMRSRSTLC